MATFDFTAPADLFAIGAKRSSKVVYRKFSCGADAIRHAMEALSHNELRYAIVESDDARLGPIDIEALYWSASYPLVRQRRDGPAGAAPPAGDAASGGC